VELGYDRFLRLRHIGARAGRGFFVGDVPPGVPGHAGCGHCATNRRGQQPFLFSSAGAFLETIASITLYSALPLISSLRAIGIRVPCTASLRIRDG
jgi:hypothetical protein